MTAVIINPKSLRASFIDQLEIWHTDTPQIELTEAQARQAAEEWCAKNDYTCEGLFWQEEGTDIWTCRVCPNSEL